MRLFEVVNSEWIKEKLKTHKLKQKDLAEAIGTDDFQISRWVHNSTISTPSKCALYYYFRCLELEKTINSKDNSTKI
jgi:transcriptional regulator with XRE-family HTH domain